jgi:hypothetical protein
MHKCALAIDQRMFVTKGGRRWLTYSFCARARIHQFQRGALPGLRSNAQMGLPACMERQAGRTEAPTARSPVAGTVDAVKPLHAPWPSSDEPRVSR